jgi:hypothetical protein
MINFAFGSRLTMTRFSDIPSCSDLERTAATDRCSSRDKSSALRPATIIALRCCSSAVVHGFGGKNCGRVIPHPFRPRLDRLSTTAQIG